MKIIQKERYEHPDLVSNYDASTGLRRSESYIIGKYFKSGDVILDVGCATGRTVREIARMGFRVTGLDYSWGMIKKAREHHPDYPLLQMDATDLMLKDDIFDVSFFSYNGLDTVVPLSGRLNVMREMTRVTKPGGLIIFSSRNILNRIFNRFRNKNIHRAVISNLSELKLQLLHNLSMFFQGYILQHTEKEGLLNVYMSTIRRNVKQFKSVCPNTELVSCIGNDPDADNSTLNLHSHMIYYIWRKSVI